MRTFILLLLSSLAAAAAVSAQPNLEGVWTNDNSTPLTRLPGYTQLFISEAEARQLDSKRLAREEDPGPNDPPETAVERSVERVSGTFRSSIIVDPPDGQLPTTDEARKRLETFRAGMILIGWWDGDTLVVETTAFTPSDRVRTSPTGDYLVSPRTVVTERFTRVSHAELNSI